MNKNHGCLYYIFFPFLFPFLLMKWMFNLFKWMLSGLFSFAIGLAVICCFIGIIVGIIVTPQTWIIAIPIIIAFSAYHYFKDKKYKDVPDFDNMTGTEFEDFCCFLLSKNGYTDVKTTKTSGDQGIDILAKKGSKQIGIQCKCYSSNIGNSAVQQAFAGAKYYKCDESIVITNRFFTKSAIDLANTTGVLLWDRNELDNLISQTYKKKHIKDNLNPEQQLEDNIKNSLDDMGKIYANAFKTFKYSDVKLSESRLTENGFEFIYEAESPEQLEYLLDFETELNENLEDTCTLNKLYGNKFILKVVKSESKEFL